MERAEFMARAIIALGTSEQRGGTRWLAPAEIIERAETLWQAYRGAMGGFHTGGFGQGVTTVVPTL